MLYLHDLAVLVHKLAQLLYLQINELRLLDTTVLQQHLTLRVTVSTGVRARKVLFH
jgi:hypothetical protein